MAINIKTIRNDIEKLSHLSDESDQLNKKAISLTAELDKCLAETHRLNKELDAADAFYKAVSAHYNFVANEYRRVKKESRDVNERLNGPNNQYSERRDQYAVDLRLQMADRDRIAFDMLSQVRVLFESESEKRVRLSGDLNASIERTTSKKNELTMALKKIEEIKAIIKEQGKDLQLRLATLEKETVPNKDCEEGIVKKKKKLD